MVAQTPVAIRYFVTVTKRGSNPGLRCRWCGRPVGDVAATGRPKQFCKRSCRQRDYEARRRNEELGLSERDLVVTRAQLDALHDQLYVLEAAVEDVERDLAGSPTKQDYAEAVEWLLDACRPLLTRETTSTR
jgi:hypothetical protein